MTSRRQFIQIIPVAGAALLATRVAHAALVDEKDPQAVALGYVADASKVNKTKYKQFVEGQNCGNCALYQAPAGDAAAVAGGCALFPGKQVARAGWCSAYAKKP
jgi:hypothetical protein